MRLLTVLLGCLLISSLTAADSDNRDPDVREIFKMSPKDILRIREAANQHEQAIYREIRSLVELSEEVEMYLSPGEPTQVVDLLQRAPSAISFVDATGTPWPVEEVNAYDGELFDAKQIENSYKNSVVLHGKLPAGTSYVAIYLQQLADPIIVRVKVSPDSYHKSKIFKIMKIGPDTELNPVTLGAAQQIGLAPDVDLNNVLFGVTPFEAKKLTTDNAEVLAWEKGDEILVRTNLSLFSPAAVRIKPGTNRYTAYRLPKASRLYAVNEVGKVVQISILEKNQ